MTTDNDHRPAETSDVEVPWGDLPTFRVVERPKSNRGRAPKEWGDFPQIIRDMIQRSHQTGKACEVDVPREDHARKFVATAKAAGPKHSPPLTVGSSLRKATDARGTSYIVSVFAVAYKPRGPRKPKTEVGQATDADAHAASVAIRGGGSTSDGLKAAKGVGKGGTSTNR